MSLFSSPCSCSECLLHTGLGGLTSMDSACGSVVHLLDLRTGGSSGIPALSVLVAIRRRLTALFGRCAGQTSRVFTRSWQSISWVGITRLHATCLRGFLHRSAIPRCQVGYLDPVPCASLCGARSLGPQGDGAPSDLGRHARESSSGGHLEGSGKACPTSPTPLMSFAIRSPCLMSSDPP